jgi:hypothetical protein
MPALHGEVPTPPDQAQLTTAAYPQQPSPAPAGQPGRSPDRDRLLLAVADMCDGAAEKCSRPAAQTVLSGLFMSMIGKVERDIRLQLADKLADATWAPPDLINYLARDDIEIARPIIARSPLLQDQDLIRLLVEATTDHHIEVARRPQLAPAVVDAILAQGDTDVLSALAANDTADVSPLAMARLVSFSQTLAGLRAPLARHPRLTAELGEMPSPGAPPWTGGWSRS